MFCILNFSLQKILRMQTSLNRSLQRTATAVLSPVGRNRKKISFAGSLVALEKAPSTTAVSYCIAFSGNLILKYRILSYAKALSSRSKKKQRRRNNPKFRLKRELIYKSKIAPCIVNLLIYPVRLQLFKMMRL